MQCLSAVWLENKTVQDVEQAVTQHVDRDLLTLISMQKKKRCNSATMAPIIYEKTTNNVVQAKAYLCWNIHMKKVC